MTEKMNIREYSSLKNRLILSVMWFVIFWVFVWMYTIPELAKIEAIQFETQNQIDRYEKEVKEGIPLSAFMQHVSDASLKKLLQTEDGNQYFVANLKNQESPNYDTFLTGRESYIDEMNKSWVLAQRDTQLNKILPSYTQGFWVEGNMSDLAFVNYIEGLLKTFWLKSTSPIGIDQVIPVNPEDTNTATQLFYIPLSLDISGRKTDVIDFLYFVQNVGEVANISKQNGVDTLTIHKDTLLPKVFAWQTPASGYNIYENKLVELDEVSLPEYIDTSSSLRPSSQSSVEGLVSFTRANGEQNDEYHAKVWLKFYVRGLPSYKIEAFIENVIEKFNTLSSEVGEKLATAKNRNALSLDGNMIEKINILSSMSVYLETLGENIGTLQAGLLQKTNLDNLYKTASDIDYQIENLAQYIQNITFEENKK